MPDLPIQLAPPGHKLTPKQWTQIERFLDEWKRDVLDAARKHPAKSYRLGYEQIKAFTGLLGNLSGVAPETLFGGEGPTIRESVKWAREYLLHELDGALSRFIDQIKSELLYGLRMGTNPTVVASRLYDATQDAGVNWRMIARTEMVRANAAGRLKAAADMGYEKVWCPPHIGSCKSCKRLLEGRVFLISEVLEATNYGRPERAWVPCIPLHPHCRHTWLPYDPDIYAEAMAQYAAMEAAGLTDEDALDDMFDSSGQLRPEYAHVDFSAAKSRENSADNPVEKSLVFYRGVDLGDAGARADTGSDDWDSNLFLTDTPGRARLYGAHVQRVVLAADTRMLFEGAPEARKVWAAARATAELGDRPLEQIVVHHALKLGYDAVHFRDQAGVGTVLMNRAKLTDAAVGKLMDPYAEMLAAVVFKVRGPAQPVRYGSERLPLADIRTDVYQRAVDPDKVHAILMKLRRGEKLKPLKVSRREDGTNWITDGQHRYEARRLNGETHADCEVRHGMTWTEEADECRGLIGKAWSPLADFDLGDDEDHDRRALTSGLLAVMKAGIPLVDALVAEPQGPCWTCGSPDHWNESDSCPGAPLDPLMFEGLRLRNDVAARARAVWGLIAGEGWDAWATLHMPAHGGPLLARVDYPAARRARPEWKALADTDLHLALVMAAMHVKDGAELAPGVPIDFRIDPDQMSARDEASLWALDRQEWVGPIPAGEPADMAKSHPAYVWTPGTGTFGVHQKSPRLLSEEEFLAKAAAPAAQPNAGVEHWITVHPHGPEEKGQPVLVRNNPDGTMTVIGGAGGNLNMLRLDPGRRVDDPARAKGSKRVEQAVSAQEDEASQAQREQEIEAARQGLAKVAEARTAATAQLHDFIGEQLGIDLAGMDHKERRKMLAKVRTSAVRTLAYGELQRRETRESASREELGLEPVERATSSKSEDPEGAERTPRPSVAQTAEQAKAILDQLLDLSQLGKVASQHRRVVNGEARGSDANQIDWTGGVNAAGTSEAKEQRRAKVIEQAVRTDLSRSLLEHGDQLYRGAKRGYDQHYKNAFVQGGFDALDSFTHSALGQSPMTKEGYRLLGVAGAAQLAAYHIQQEAQASGLDVEKVTGALKALTDEQERAVNERGLARVQTAMRRAAQARVELTNTEAGDSLYTSTMARSIAQEKALEAKRGLGMMIGGLEATSAMKVALEREAGAKIKVGGFSSPAKIKELAARAGVTVHLSDIGRVGSGSYTLSLPPDRLAHLLKDPPKVNQAYRDRLQQIRSGKDLDAEVEANRQGPGMSDTLDANQAKGKMFLGAAGSAILAFDPGVGKTHTALAAFEELRAKEPDVGHRALIVVPKNMLQSWANTIHGQGAGRSVEVLDGSTKQKQQGYTGNADYTIVSYETLKSGSVRSLIKRPREDGSKPHSTIIADELQKAKNDDSQNFGAIEDAIDAAREHHGDDTHFFGLSGTPVEKKVTDLRSMRALARRAKGKETADRKTEDAKYGKLGQDESISRGDRIRQFRKGLDEDMFRLSAQDAGNDLPEAKRQTHQVKLSPEHHGAMAARVQRLNTQIADYHAKKKAGLEPGKLPNFGGRDALMDSLYNHEDAEGGNAITRQAADIIDGLGTFKHKGGQYITGYDDAGRPIADPSDHAGSYEHKSVVFGSNETSKTLFGQNWSGGVKGGMHAELEKRGVKVFIGHGQMGAGKNEASYKAFLAHPGKAVFLTNDTNNAGISLQFGNNKGAFQHGATHMIHLTKPVNNATVQQREARILRKGAEVVPTYHDITAGTPIEQRTQETLERELRTQDLAANSDAQVAGADTLAHHLARAGVNPDKPRAEAA